MRKKTTMWNIAFLLLVAGLFDISFSLFSTELRAMGEQLSPQIARLIEKASRGLIYRLWMVAAIFIAYILVAYRGRKNAFAAEHSRYKSILEDGEKEAELLKKRAEIDLLTGFYNKLTVEEKVDEYISTHRSSGKCALLLVDIDNFKVINDTMGHPYGDEVIRFIAEKMAGLFRGDDLLGRIGGDEFVVFLKNVPNSQTVLERGERICEVFRKFADETGGEIQVSGTVGACISDANRCNFAELYAVADIALYERKSCGKNGCTIQIHSQDPDKL